MPKTRKPSDLEINTQPELHDQQFAAVRGLVGHLKGIIDGLIKDCPRDAIESLSQYEECILALVAMLALAQRQLLPSGFNGDESGAILNSIAADLTLDETLFAERLSAIAKASHFLTAVPELVLSLRAILSEPRSQEILANPLVVGWAYQCLLTERRVSFAANHDYQSLSASDIALADLPILTQWFTPDWISKFLVSEVIDRLGIEKDLSLIDPCLGTGHIFVQALRQRAKQLTAQMPIEAALEKILAGELYGCDLDKQVFEIACFSIYLACRDLAPVCELPLPQIFHFDGRGFGSLYLSLKDRPAVDLFGLNGPVDFSKLERAYSAVVTNPPYLSHRLMPKDLASFLKLNYSPGRFDLYAAFIQLCMNLTEGEGIFALICQQSFMSITRYEELRSELLNRFALRTLVQLGSGVFASRKGEKVSNAIVIAQGKKERQDEVEGWRILSDDEQALAQRRGIRQLPNFRVAQESFRKFPGKQFAFWCPDEISTLFELPSLASPESGIESSNGLFTCNNKQFLKFFWQVEPHESCHYVPYDKGGGSKWYYTTPVMLNWQDDGNVVRAYRKERGQSVALPGERYYFKPGVTYSYIGTRGFKARLLSPGSVFDIASSALFCDDPNYLLGFLNSSLARFLLGLLNPTINFQIGDLRRLPYKKPTDRLRQSVADIVLGAIEIAQQLETYDSRSPNYSGPVLLHYLDKQAMHSSAELIKACYLHREVLERLNEEESQLQQEIDQLIFDHYGISDETRLLIAVDPWVARNQKLINELPTDKQLLAELEASRKIVPAP